MLDTFILDIPLGSYKINPKDFDRFSPSIKTLPSDFSFYRKFVNNPTTADKRLGVYKPKLTIYKRGGAVTLRIEASAGKVLFNNNLMEVTQSDFDTEIQMLQEKIESMGVKITKQVLKNASVVGFHPSKNIVISGGYSTMSVISELAKVNLNEKLDLTQTKFRNSGHGLQYYSKSHSLTFYDKNYDLAKSENRAFDKDQNIQQLSLFDYLEKKNKPEILRMEVRLSEKVKMNNLLVKLGYKKNPTFSEIFTNNICQSVLFHYFNTYILPSLFIFDLDNNPQSLLKRILKQNPNTKPSTALTSVALQLLSKDNGVRNLRKIIATNFSLKSWERMAPQIRLLNDLASTNTSHTFIKNIQDALQKFEPYRF